MYSILLVDDEPEILTACHLILSQAGYEVRCARHGLEALECIEQHVPDLVVTDWAMPVMDGAELCRQIRARPELAHVPLLIHTATTFSVQPEQGYCACLRKPAPVDLFLTTVGQLCEEGRVR
ncbi:response regulator [Paraburkholderia ferrariae]|uniref:response regulator n=1 Tax=Paraburkholderia ferrariae TaxID=386056 RepID=UPI000480300F|nr:response regulator [Paraburkholderia ferrariae]